MNQIPFYLRDTFPDGSAEDVAQKERQLDHLARTQGWR